MSEIRDHVAYLSQTIGPRPAGTEEEQQAALYITERLQVEAELPAVIEDFNCNPDFDIPRALCAGVSVLVAIVAMVVPMMAIPAFVVTLLAALLFAAESFDRPVVSRFFNKGVSQNVVAKYEPAVEDSAQHRRRKIILVAHYDSGKVRRDLSGRGLGFLSIAKWAELAGMVLLPVIFLLRCLVSFGGVALIVVNVITVCALLCAALSIASLAANRTAAYNEAANCNAAGVAVMMEVASRVGRAAAWSSDDPSASSPSLGNSAASEEGEAASANLGSTASAADVSSDSTSDAVMHGERAVRESGLLPQDAQLSYDEPSDVAPAGDLAVDDSPAARLLAAKAAIAAMTGRSVSPTVNIDLPAAPSADSSQSPAELAGSPVSPDDLAAGDDLLSGFGEAGLAAGAQRSEAVSDHVETMPSSMPEASSSSSSADGSDAGDGDSADRPALGGADPAEQKPDVPEWFVKAQQKAKKPAEEAPVQRSRYADALDAAVRESSAHFQEANRVIEAETAMHLRQLRNNIMEVKAPGFEQDDPAPSLRPAMAEPASTLTMPARSDAALAASSSAAQVLAASTGVLSTGLAVASSQESGEDRAVREAAKPVRSLAGVNLASLAAASRKEFSSALSPDASELGSTAEIEPVGNIDDMPESAPCSAEASSSAEPAALAGRSEREKPTPRRRRTIALPNIGAKAQDLVSSSPAASAEAGASRASSASNQRPLPTRRRLSALLPSVEPADSQVSAAPALNTPVLSSAQLPVVEAFDACPQEDDGFNRIDAFADGGVCEDEAQDGYEAYDGGYVGECFAADEQQLSYDSPVEEVSDPGIVYAEVPKSRTRGFMDKFRFGRKKKLKEETQSSPQEWLDVDDDFNAREVGAARGGWESFRQTDAFEEDLGSTTAFPPISAEGGAADGDERFGGASESRRTSASGRSWNGGAFSRDQLGRVSTLSEDTASDGREEWAGEVDRELEQIYRFRNPEINTEVWFVALGSELASNGGMKAFLHDHAAELKGSVFVELDALGSGELSVVSKEGLYRPRAASSRLKRYAKKAAQALGLHVSEEPLLWANTAAAYAMQRGCQAVHIAGFADGKPASYGEANDVLENISEETLQRNADYVMEIIRQI